MSVDVLIADQDVELANLYCRFLADHGFSVEGVECGLECLDVPHVPDVLVWTASCPGAMHGNTCLSAEDDLSLPVILTTWNASPESIRKLVVPPVVHCLRKFFPLPALLDGIHFAAKCDGTVKLFPLNLSLLIKEILP